MTVRVYRTKEFKKDFKKLSKNNSYSHLERLIIDYFFNKSTEGLKSGTNINRSEDSPFIKKRIPHSGGFRFYYILLIKKDSVYLIYTHPKTGSMGFDSLSPESMREFQKKGYNCIKNNDLYEISHNEATDKLVFMQKK